MAVPVIELDDDSALEKIMFAPLYAQFSSFRNPNGQCMWCYNFGKRVYDNKYVEALVARVLLRAERGARFDGLALQGIVKEDEAAERQFKKIADQNALEMEVVRGSDMDGLHARYLEFRKKK